MRGTHQYQFDGAVQFLPNKNERLLLDPTRPVYVGTSPTPAMDEAWERLIGYRYWSISEQEAKRLWGVSYVHYRDYRQGGYTGGQVNKLVSEL